MQNKITYIGNVKIKIKDKPPVRRNNNGTNAFFNALRDILITAGDAKSTRLPYYMAIIKSTDEVLNSPNDFFNTYTTYDNSIYNNLKLVLSPIVITSKSKKYDNSTKSFTNGACVLSALLPSSLTITISDEEASLGTVFLLLLSGEENKKILAFASADYTELSPVFTNSNNQAVIDWELTFSNKESK